ncbi:uncharacterized protein K02A2.6-like [Saccostrea cucullata]|uniref:uncharacterized protein K02A2.6-like n=1 Tax=Saccostrea cuccullata TaxID=36930 RepID=UPI002ED26D3D
MHAVDTSDEEFFIGSVNVNGDNHDVEWYETVKVKDTYIHFQLDTGAKCNVLSSADLKKIDKNWKVTPTCSPLKSFSGHNIRCAGLVQRIHSIERKNRTVPHGISQDYQDLFSGLGCLPGTYSIKVDENIQPVIHPPRKIPIALRDKVKEELDRMEREGVIVKQREPTKWINSMTKLDDESSKLCTFNSPFGRYRFTRMPFGIKSAPEVFQRAISEMIQDLDGTEAIIDDIIVWGTTEAEHDRRLKALLDRARQHNLKLSVDKSEIRRSELTYVGHRFTDSGLKTDPEKVRAVQEMDRPNNVKDLQTFMGFVQYLGKFMPNLSEVGSPLRQLLEKNSVWKWENEQEESYEKLKRMTTSAPILQYFDPNKPVMLSVDASSNGLGAVLIQEDKPVAYGSRALTETQQRYSQIEKETLAILYGCTKFHDYVYGHSVLVESDHKPLESILKKPVLSSPPRLQRSVLALERYDIQVIYKPGKKMFLADHLSRSYLKETKEALVPDLQVNEMHLTSYLPVSQEVQDRIRKETGQDDELQQLLNTILDGWPNNKADLAPEIRAYWNFRDELSCIDGILYKSHKLVVPKSMQNEMLEKLHIGHQGIVKTKNRARDILFWNGMGRDIENLVSACATCAKYQVANPKEPMIPSELPSRPWSKIGMDLFELSGNHYLLVVYQSGRNAKLELLTSKCVITHLKSMISKYGIPDIMISDNGPQFSSYEFKEFVKSYYITHTTTSPYHAQSNGQTERMVQTMKRLITKSQDPYLALLEYRNTKIDGIDMSPAQLFLGHRLKSILPTAVPLLKSWVDGNALVKMKRRQKKQEENFNRHAKKEPLKPLKAGDSVIESKGRCYRRNRKFLRPTRVRNNSRDDVPAYTDVTLRTKTNQSTNDTSAASDVQPNTVTETARSDVEPPAENPAHFTRSGRCVKLPARYRE